MTTDTKFNGWTNHETWAANLWLTNDQELYDQARDRVLAEENDYDASKAVKALLEGVTLYLLSETASLAYDLLSSSIDRVNCIEIAEHLRED
jgi:hypothetical protein